MATTHVGDDPMEPTLGVAKPVLSRRELPKILRRTWHLLVEQPEHDPACRLGVDRDIKLRCVRVGCQTLSSQVKCGGDAQTRSLCQVLLLCTTPQVANGLYVSGEKEGMCSQGCFCYRSRGGETAQEGRHFQ
jgi:hypothetical protein